MGVISWCNVGHAALIHHFQSVCESGTLAARLKIQCCINKARDTLPTFSFALISWSRERFLSSSLPALTQNYGDVSTRHVWACVCVCVRTATYTHHLYVCMSTSVCSSPCCLDNPLPFLFLFALGAESGLTPTQEQESEQREDGAWHRTGLFSTTPTALPPALTRRAADVGWSCWYGYSEGREKRVSSVLRKWLNC